MGWVDHFRVSSDGEDMATTVMEVESVSDGGGHCDVILVSNFETILKFGGGGVGGQFD